MFLTLVCLYTGNSPRETKTPLSMLFSNHSVSNPSRKHMIGLQVLVSELLLTFSCSNLNLLATNLVPPCLDSPNILCCRNFLLHRGLLFAYFEDTLCIRKLGELPLLSNSEYSEGLTIPLQSHSPFTETFDTTWILS